ncbi:site-specific integrase [Limibacter armeniacum]|uniref:tyrosine-type recombinase/integrase n=1 Tax=Limibacter armeniacum TaxID=466084 RepID=UPI002FE52F49
MTSKSVIVAVHQNFRKVNANVQYYQRGRKNSDSVTIYARIHCEGEKGTGFSTGITCKLIDWGGTRDLIKSSYHSADNQLLQNFRNEIKMLYARMKPEFKQITPKMLQNEYNKQHRGKHIKLVECAQLFLEKKKEEVTTSSYDAYRYRMNKILDHFKEIGKDTILIAEITKSLGKDFMTWMLKKKGYSEHYTARALNLLNMMLNWAVEEDYLQYNHLKDLKLNPKSKSKMIYLDRDELKQLEAYQPRSKSRQKAADVFRFLCYTGMSYIDYTLFRYDKHVEYIRRAPHIRQNRQKNDQEFLVPLSEKALELLQKYDYVLPFVSHPMINKHLKRIVQEVGSFQYCHYGEVLCEDYRDQYY